jgi:hypothetical protein
VFLVVFLVVGLILWPFLFAQADIPSLWFWLFVGLVCAPLAALIRGGSAVIKHCALRLILWINRYTPFNFIKFLDHCAKLILLKKVGGGYIFIHRMLLEIFC